MKTCHLPYAFLAAVICGHAAAEEFDARILDIANGKVTFQKGKAIQPFADEITLPVADKVKVLKAHFNKAKTLEAGDPVPGGLQNEQLKNVSPEGFASKIITDDSGKTIREMWVLLPPEPPRIKPAPLVRPASARGKPDPDPLPPHALARFGTLRFRHSDGNILASAVSPDGRMLATAGTRSVQVWNAENGQRLLHLEHHRSMVQKVAFSPDSKRLAIFDYAGKLQFTALDTGKTVKEFDLKLAPGGGPNIASFISFLPDGKQLILINHREPIVHVLDATSGAELRAFRHEGRSIDAVALSHDGQTLAVAEMHGTVRLWNVVTGKERLELEKRTAGPCRALAFSPDAKMLATGGTDARLWDAATGKLLHTLAPRITLPGAVKAPGEAARPQAVRETSLGAVLSVSFSPDGRQLVATHGRAIVLWDPATGKEIRRWLRQAAPFFDRVHFLPDGRTLLITRRSAATLYFLDAMTGEPCRTFDGHESEITALAYSPDGKQIATAQSTGSGGIRVWDRSSRQVVWQSGPSSWGAQILAFSPKGNVLAAATGHNIILWDLKTGDPRPTLPAQMAAVIALAISRDGRRLASCNSDGRVHLFDLASGKELQNLRIAKPHAVAVAFSPDLSLGASIAPPKPGTSQSEVQLWDLATGKAVKSFPAAWSGQWLAFSPDGRTLLQSAGSHQVVLWEVATGQQRRSIPLADSAGQVASTGSVAFSPDGRRIAAGELGHMQLGQKNSEPRFAVWVIDLDHESPPALLPGHKGIVKALSFSPDGRLLASASSDTTALLWDIAALDAAGPAVPLTPDLRTACWRDLGGDARQAYASMWKLADDPGAIDFLGKELKPAPRPPDAATVERWLTDLDSKQFAVRSKASRQLAELGPAVGGELRKALTGTLSSEARRRVENVLQALESQQLRSQRAVEVLERMNNAVARPLLEKLAQGAPEALLTQEAKTTLARLASGNCPTP